METTQTVPYKIGKVSFVPSGGLAAVSKEVLTVSDMNSNNCLQIFQFDQNTIQRTWSSPTESKVTDVQWMAENALLKSDESGMLGFMKWTNQKLDEIQKWKSIQSRINSISLLKYNDIAGAVTTESGRVALFSLDQKEYIRTYSDECSVLCSKSVSISSFISGNAFGQIKWWDVRSNSVGAERTFDLIDYGVGINAITQHPGRTNLILGGASDGMIYIWDIRKDKVPITAIDNHVASVTSVEFHSHRSMVVSSGLDGKICSLVGTWDSTPELTEKDLTPVFVTESINSVDLCDEFLAAGGDDAKLILKYIG